MRRSFTYLRRGLLGAVIAGSLGFGVTQAFASPEETRAVRYCTNLGYDYDDPGCAWSCGGQGYCSYRGICRCGQIP